MLKLKFDEAQCFSCQTHDCLVKYQYLHLSNDQAKADLENIIRGDSSFVLTECATCYACEECCSWGNHPFYLIGERQEERGLLTAPRPITNQGQAV